jgi:hypothetical protein
VGFLHRRSAELPSARFQSGQRVVKLPVLQTLNLYHTKVTDEGIKKLQRALPQLQQALPNCGIYHGSIFR